MRNSTSSINMNIIKTMLSMENPFTGKRKMQGGVLHLKTKSGLRELWKIHWHTSWHRLRLKVVSHIGVHIITFWCTFGAEELQPQLRCRHRCTFRASKKNVLRPFYYPSHLIHQIRRFPKAERNDWLPNYWYDGRTRRKNWFRTFS